MIRPLGSQTVELYDLRTDLGETTDVADRHPDIVKRILAIAREAHVSVAALARSKGAKSAKARRRDL